MTSHISFLKLVQVASLDDFTRTCNSFFFYLFTLYLEAAKEQKGSSFARSDLARYKDWRVNLLSGWAGCQVLCTGVKGAKALQNACLPEIVARRKRSRTGGMRCRLNQGDSSYKWLEASNYKPWLCEALIPPPPGTRRPLAFLIHYSSFILHQTIPSLSVTLKCELFGILLHYSQAVFSCKLITAEYINEFILAPTGYMNRYHMYIHKYEVTSS